MEAFKQAEVEIDFYNSVKKRFDTQDKPYSEQEIGSRKKLYSGSQLIATYSTTQNLELGELTKPQFNSFLGSFNKHLYAQFNKNQFLYDLKVTFTGSARSRNLELWDSLKIGTYFYNVDLDSAYWQIAYKLGYISKKMFDTYHTVDSYKQVKRYCISFLAREVKMSYTTQKGVNVIKCETQVLKQVYDNIRSYLYYCIQQATENIKDCLEYNIDGVSVMSYDLDAVKNNLKKMELFFKITQCRKVSETDYLYGYKQRKFKNK